MNVQPNPPVFDLNAFLEDEECKRLLRVVVCGSSGHGKSTVMGRLLYEAGAMSVDQVAVLHRDSGRHGTSGDEPRYALVLDGLVAEHEQNITIDVAWRSFATAWRRFMIMDAPGHERYTRKMVTAASSADLAVLLVSAREGLTRQTRRHIQIVSMLGVRHIVVAINKMDLVDWWQPRFAAIEAEVLAYLADLDFEEMAFIPVSGRTGDNVVYRSLRLRWYRGPALLEYLENLQVAPRPRRSAFRMPVQWVNNPNPNFRGYCGLVAGGEAVPGLPVQVLPSGRRTKIERIVTADGELAIVHAGQSVTITFADGTDASRGDVIAEIGPPADTANRLCAFLIWIGADPLVPGRILLLKIAAATVNATIEPGLQIIDLDTGRVLSAERLVSNDIGTAIVGLDRYVAVDRYADNMDTGGFILIDPKSFETVGIGIVEVIHPGEAGHWHRRPRRSEFSSTPDSIAAEVPTKTGLQRTQQRIRALISWAMRRSLGSNKPK